MRTSRFFSATAVGLCLVLLFASGCGKKTPPRLAVLGFADEQGNSEPSLDLVAVLTARLATNGWELVERADINHIFQEQSISLSGQPSLQDAVAAGKLLRADWILTGQVFKEEDNSRALLAKIIDARRGIILNFGAFKLDDAGWFALAEPILGLALTTRMPPQTQPIFIAVGAFEDVGIDNRYRDFGRKLRRKLSQAQHSRPVLVLEREMVGPLVDELRMSHLGLSVDAQPNIHAQPSSFLISGFYQAYRDERSKLNLIVRVERLGAGVQTFSINEPVGDDLDNKVIARIEQLLDQPAGSPVNRREEAAELLESGLDRLHLLSVNGVLRPEYILRVPNERVQLERDRNEAIKILQSALLLDSDNPEIKYSLGAGFLTPEINRPEEGMSYLLEVMASSTNQLMVMKSREVLAMYQLDKDPAQAMSLLEGLVQKTDDPAKRAQYSHTLQDLYQRLMQTGRITVQDRLARQAQSFRHELLAQKALVGSRRGPNFRGAIIDNLQSFHRILGENPTNLVNYLDTLQLEMQSDFPEMMPHLLCGYIWIANRDNPPHWLNSYEQLLETVRRDPAKIFHPPSIYAGLISNLDTHHRARNNALVYAVIQTLLAAGPEVVGRESIDRVLFMQGWYLRMEGDLAKARDAFQQIGDRPVNMGLPGPWGWNDPYNGAKAAEECQRLLAGAPPPKSQTTSLGEPVVRLRGSCRMASDGPRLWLIAEDQLLAYEKSSRTLRTVSLQQASGPLNSASLVAGRDTIWVGTQGRGLIAFDKRTETVKTYSTAQGLLRPHIRELFEGGNRLWIGFGTDEPMSLGGLGYLDLRTDTFTGLMGELMPQATAVAPGRRGSSNMTAPGQPTRGLVSVFVQTTPDEFFILLHGALRKLELAGKSLTIITNISTGVYCAAANEAFIIAGGNAGLHVCDRSADSWRLLTQADGLPENRVRCLALDGQRAWIASGDTLVSLSLPQGKVNQVFSLDWPGHVSELELDGNELWARASSTPPATRIYRLTLED